MPVRLWSAKLMPVQPQRRRRRLILLVLVVCTVAVGVVRRDAVISSLGHALVRSDALVKADAIVVLGGGVPERELAAADLYLAGWAPRLVITQEPEKMALGALQKRGVRAEWDIDRRVRFLRELKIPDEAVVRLPGIMVSTADEAQLVSRWSRDHHVRRLIVVTSSFHTRRAGYVFDWALKGQNVAVAVYAAAMDGFDPDTWWRSRPSLLKGIVEWQKTIFYRLRYL